jgi:hypothetical protein
LGIRKRGIVSTLSSVGHGKVRVERALEQTKAGLRFKEPKTKHGRRSIKVPASVIAQLKAH